MPVYDRDCKLTQVKTMIKYDKGVIKISVKKGTNFDAIREDLSYFVDSLGFLLNTSEYRGRTISFLEFSKIIEESFYKNGHTLSAVAFFKKLDMVEVERNGINH